MNKYEVLGVVGEGAYGVVLKCLNKETNEIMAIKKFKEGEEDENIRKNAHREVKMLKQLKHRNVVDLKEAFRRKGKLYLVFEYVDKNLLEVIEENKNGVNPELIQSIIYQLLQALDFLHKNNVIHRDIKPENLLLSNSHGTLKLCDFGFARTVSDQKDQLTDYVATRWYRPPELLLNSKNYDKSVDLWAAACIMAELVDSKPLFPGQDDLDQLYLIQRSLGKLTGNQLELLLTNPKFKGKMITTGIEQTITERYEGKISPLGLDLMKNLLKIDPKLRLTAEQAIQHPYFDSVRGHKARHEHSAHSTTGVVKGPSTDNIISRNESHSEIKKDESTTPMNMQSNYANNAANNRKYDENLYRKIVESVGDTQSVTPTEKASVAGAVPNKSNGFRLVSLPKKQPVNNHVSNNMMVHNNNTNGIQNANNNGKNMMVQASKNPMESTNSLVYNAQNQQQMQQNAHVSNKMSTGIKTLKNFYGGPQQINNNSSTTTVSSLPRNTADLMVSGSQNNAKIVKLTLYPFSDMNYGAKSQATTTTAGSTTLGPVQNTSNLRKINDMSNVVGAQNNSLLPQIHMKSNTSTSTNSTHAMKTVGNGVNSYNIPLAKTNTLISHHMNDKKGGETVVAGNSGGISGGFRSFYNSGMYNYSIGANRNGGSVATSNVNNIHYQNTRIAAKVM